ncbi:hypothetical protein TRVL_01926 [Trypanosoma vivax]|nr:hypothetical protein TRVL_01926 [Trypanosoma vivax]
MFRGVRLLIRGKERLTLNIFWRGRNRTKSQLKEGEGRHEALELSKFHTQRGGYRFAFHKQLNTTSSQDKLHAKKSRILGAEKQLFATSTSGISSSMESFSTANTLPVGTGTVVDYCPKSCQMSYTNR